MWGAVDGIALDLVPGFVFVFHSAVSGVEGVVFSF